MTSIQSGLEYQVSGRDGGFPVVVHHGLIGSAAVSGEAAGIADEVGVQLITIARPGYGRSTPRTMSSIAEWSTVVRPLLDHLHVDRYAVWGVSAGAPYAYCLAAADPDRVAAVVITSGLGHVADPAIVEHYDEPDRRAFAFFRDATQSAVRDYWREALQRSLDEHMGTDWQPLLQSALANGAAGPGREAVLQQRAWGFSVESIDGPVHVWHAPGDPMVPFSTARAIVQVIPNARLHEQAEPDHIPSPATVRAALSYLATLKDVAW